MTDVLQPFLDAKQRAVAAKPLPGMQALDGRDWIVVDGAYQSQLAEKEALLEERCDDVLACLPCAHEAVAELLDEVLTLLQTRPDFEITGKSVRRADGQHVEIDREAPLETISQLIQEDVCILQKDGNAHRLTAALLCFPASWTLSEKIGHGLPAIHRPVPEYDHAIAGRVQRLFDGIKAGHPIWRANLLRYEKATLYQPRSERDPRESALETPLFERSERQTLWRLPKSQAVVFSIHTTVIALRNS